MDYDNLVILCEYSSFNYQKKPEKRLKVKMKRHTKGFGQVGRGEHERIGRVGRDEGVDSDRLRSEVQDVGRYDGLDFFRTRAGMKGKYNHNLQCGKPHTMARVHFMAGGTQGGGLHLKVSFFD